MNKLLIISLSVSMACLPFGCAKDKRDISSCESIDEAVAKLEEVCLSSHDTNRVFCIKERTHTLKNDYEVIYLGSIKSRNEQFELLQKTILSGQEIDARRANVSILLFTSNKLYGEYTGLNNHYSVSVKSNSLCLYSKGTRRMAKFKMSDSIPSQLFIPLSVTDTISTGNLFYLNKPEASGCQR